MIELQEYECFRPFDKKARYSQNYFIFYIITFYFDWPRNETVVYYTIAGLSRLFQQTLFAIEYNIVLHTKAYFILHSYLIYTMNIIYMHK